MLAKALNIHPFVAGVIRHRLKSGLDATLEPLVSDDKINRPAHYVAGRTIEPIDAIEDWGLGFCLGNAVKYIARAGRKGDAREDLEKAIWYIRRHIDKLGG